jgi:hypothetical protein
MITVISIRGARATMKMGQPKPDILNKIVSLTATGEELEAIKKLFVNIPMKPGAKQMEWRNDWAQFIFDNLDPTDHIKD